MKCIVQTLDIRAGSEEPNRDGRFTETLTNITAVRGSFGDSIYIDTNNGSRLFSHVISIEVLP